MFVKPYKNTEELEICIKNIEKKGHGKMRKCRKNIVKSFEEIPKPFSRNVNSQRNHNDFN